MRRFSHVWHCVWLREVPDGVSPLLASFVRQSETLLVDVTLSVRQKLSKNCTEFYLVERQVRESHRCVLSLQRCSWSLTSACRMARTVKAVLLRVANDRISCARKHFCPKAFTVEAVFYVSRTTVFLVHGSTCARRHVLSNSTLCTPQRTTF